MSYRDAYQEQLKLMNGVISGTEPDTLVIVEHPPVLTLGANFHEENLLYPGSWYHERGIEIVKTDRGGDITYHGPGQIVAYPIVDVSRLGKDLHLWMRDLEEVVIRTLSHTQLTGERLEVNSGVWVNQKKICAIGIKMRRWVSMHGIALNCTTQLEPFQWIVPCGIRTHGVTSIENEFKSQGFEQAQELAHPDRIRPLLVQQFHSVFEERVQTLHQQTNLDQLTTQH